MDEDCVLIGGPHDGRRMSSKEAFLALAEIDNAHLLLDVEGSPLAGVTVRKVLYRRSLIQVGDERLSFYVWNAITDSAAMRLLLDRHGRRCGV